MQYVTSRPKTHLSRYEVIPVGDSPARAPQFTTVHRYADWHSGTESVYESNPYMPYEDREQAEEHLFPAYAWPGGYPIAYVGDGFMLCAACALEAFRDPNVSDHDLIHAGEIVPSVYYPDTEDSDGVTCDNCYQYIVEPFDS